jgi:metacaspase-1
MRKALLVGINTYRQAPLAGPTNDIKLMFRILGTYYGFKQIRVLTNTAGTKKDMLQALRWLVEGAKPHDEILFQFSGHGSQVACGEGDEDDGLDEVLCSADVHLGQFVKDDDLKAIFAPLDPRVNLTVILDCCHAGTGLRKDTPVLNRFYPLDLFPSKPAELEVLDKGRTRKKKEVVITPDQGNAVLISACADYQYAADSAFGQTYHGALTYYLAQCLKDQKWLLTYRELIECVNARLSKEEFEQEAQLEGKAELFDKVFLGGPVERQG